MDRRSLREGRAHACSYYFQASYDPTSDPTQTIWTARNLVQNCTPDTDVPHLAVSSTTTEWEEQAKSLFRAKRYLQARHCFQRAEQPHRADVANAYYLRDCATLKEVSASRRLQDERLVAFVAAAEAFAQCADGDTSGANERERSGYYRRAGESYEEAGRPYFKRAAEVCLLPPLHDAGVAQNFQCFERAAERAGTREERESLCVHAAKLYREVGDFDDAVRVVQHHKLQRHQDGARIITAAKLFYFNRDEIQSVLSLAPEDMLTVL